MAELAERDEIYPSYKKLINEFKLIFERFCTFSEQNGLGVPAINQWELTYIDAFAKGEYWNMPAEWAKFLPGCLATCFQLKVWILFLNIGLPSGHMKLSRILAGCISQPDRAERIKMPAINCFCSGLHEVPSAEEVRKLCGLDLILVIRSR